MAFKMKYGESAFPYHIKGHVPVKKGTPSHRKPRLEDYKDEEAWKKALAAWEQKQASYVPPQTPK